MLGQKIVRPDTTPGELVLVRYVGRAKGGVVLVGPCTGTRYEFAPDGERYVDRRDFEAVRSQRGTFVEAEE
jgi:hypothetical protein